MNAKTLVAGVAAGGGAAMLVARRMDPRRIHHDGNGHQHTDRWHMVTVNRPPQEVMPDGRLPDPLAELGDKIDVQVRPAPGDRGTELGARLRGPVPAGLMGAAAKVAGTDPRQELRKALRAAKSILETGEVLSPDKRPSTRPTVTNIPVRIASRRARGEGRL